MAHAADMMELAREEIFIAGWWLSPEIYMKRPALEGNHWRFDEILKRKANQGVRIFILMYKEMEMALGLNSIYSKRTLQALHPNIKVMRHPDHYMSTGTFFWAHHEKLVIIDQLIAFVGGVDLCFGRWDDHCHVLTDLGSVKFGQQHLMTKDINMASGLRSLVSAPLTLSPLGLEENENVDVKEKDGLTNTVAERARKPHKVTNITIGGIDEERYADLLDESADDGEGVFADTCKEGVLLKISPKGTRSVSADSPRRYPSSENASGSESHRDRTISTAAAPGKKTLLNVVHDAKGRKYIRRAASALTRPRVPSDLLDKAGPPPSVFENAKKLGMDFSTAAEKYKEYVESGAVQKEKHRSQTPPVKRKESRFTRAVENWRSNRAKKKWKQVLDSDEVTAGYELDFLRLKKMDSEEKESIDGGVKLWVGKDYVNYIHKDFIDVDLPFHDFIDRGCTPRMPWHDIHSVTFGAPARDVARHFIQRWNATKTEKLKDDLTYPCLLPKSYENLKVPRVFKNPTFSYNVNVQVKFDIFTASLTCLPNDK
ncbi:hypothetical protein KIN20_012017 [Parelaphostrongylus tenuis]|nr:hypothetical protein KIN20_012017 [Parelaphostrongylus tenuis]